MLVVCSKGYVYGGSLYNFLNYSVCRKVPVITCRDKWFKIKSFFPYVHIADSLTMKTNIKRGKHIAKHIIAYFDNYLVTRNKDGV